MAIDLVKAAGEGDSNKVLKALESGADVNARNEFGDTVLMEAAKHGHLDMVKLLLDRGADINANSQWGRSSLMYAASFGHAETAAILLDEGAYVDATDKHGDTALTQASAQIDAVKILLERGADANWRNLVGTSALMRAAKYGHEKVVRLLIEYGADVNAQNTNGSTALMRASSYGHAAIARELLQLGAQIDLRDRDEGTALMRAAASGHLETVQILLSTGADPYARNKNGNTALSFAAMFGHAAVVKTLAEKQYLRSTADLTENHTDDYGDSPLIISARLGYLDVVQVLIDELESENHNKRLVQQLNKRNKQGDSALIEAARQGHYEITKFLLEKGADPNCRNLKGETAITVAPLEDDCNLYDLLAEKSGAPINQESGQKVEISDTIIETASVEEDRPELDNTFGEWPTRSRIMRATFMSARHASESEGTILLLGESGSGKDFLAQYIHRHSLRASNLFRSVNCAALPRELAESELFGHERGSFTGATSRKRGVFELADGGTVFLNEIGDMSLELQAKLLTFLDSHSFSRVGGETEIKSDTRIIAATNKDLNKEVAAGRFRLDLYYRLAVWLIGIPPLRERIEDIPLLTKSLVSDLCAKSKLVAHDISPGALHKLSSHHWEGNVRELKNVLERALILCHGNPIDSEHIVLKQSCETVSANNTGAGKLKRRAKPNLGELCVAYNQYVIKQGWSRARLADLLGVDSSTLKKWFKEAGLPAGSAGRPKKERI